MNAFEANVSQPANRRVRVFVSSTFHDMVEDRNALMTHCWPELRRFCQERQVELVEVDLRWGIAEEQSTRRETLKLCLDEITACRPFFIGLLGERYGWVPSDDAFTADLEEEQAWLKDLHGHSVTELEILLGVLNNPEMAGRASFYFRDPAFKKGEPGFASADAKSAEKQGRLKDLIRKACSTRKIPLHENYSNPTRLASLVLADLTAAIDEQFPIETIPDALTREVRDHEAFADSRCRSYIRQPAYFEALDHHAAGDGGPLVVLGESGSGKSALLANWVDRWRVAHAADFVFQHYIGGTPDSADHWRLMTRLIAAIKRWADDPEELPKSHDNILRTFSVWLAKARSTAERQGVRCIIILDALNQLEEADHARLLGWLPAHPFSGPLRLIVSTLPGETLKVGEDRGWTSLRIQPLTPSSRHRMISRYLKLFGKKLDRERLRRLATAPAAANPLYLKTLLDELRVTGTHERLDESLGEYLEAPDVPALLQKVLHRYQHDYERDRPALVGEALGLIWSARRGLSETELLCLLRPADLPQLPPAIWSPLRAAIEDALVDRRGILNFGHNFLRTAVETAFVSGEHRQTALRLQLADYFDKQPVSARSCDELPWLLRQTKSYERLRGCLLDIDRFWEIQRRGQEELIGFWVGLKEERAMGKAYLSVFGSWSNAPGREGSQISTTANNLAAFLDAAALPGEAEPLMRRALAIDENTLGLEHTTVARDLNNLATLLEGMNRVEAAEPMLRRALTIWENCLGSNHPNVASALSNLAKLLKAANRILEAESLLRRSISIFEKCFGEEHTKCATALNNLAQLLEATNRLAEAESLMRRVLAIDENTFGPEHPNVSRHLNNLGQLLLVRNHLADAERMFRRALAIDERSFGPEHPRVATVCGNLGALLQTTDRLAESESLLFRALTIDEKNLGPLTIWENCLGSNHPNVASALSNLAKLLKAANRILEAESLLRRSISIFEKCFGEEHTKCATALNNLAQLLEATNRLAEAESLMRRVLAIDENTFGPEHPNVSRHLNNLGQLLLVRNHLADAERMFRRALAIDERSFGPEHPRVATVCGNLGALLQTTDRLAESESLLFRALTIDEKNLGPNHPDVATDLINVAGVLQRTNHVGDAEAMIRRALGIDEKILGPKHRDVSRDLNNLAVLLKDANRFAEAEPLMLRALAIDEDVLGPEHTDVANRLNNLAALYCATGRIGEAEPLLWRALAIHEKSFGPDHPLVATCLNNLAVLLQGTKRLQEAEPLMRRALEIDRKSFGAMHPKVASDRGNLRTLLQTIERLEEALRVLANNERILGRNHPDVATSLNRLAVLLRSLNRTEEAQVLYGRALAIDESNFGQIHYAVGRDLLNLGMSFSAMNQLGKAEEFMRRSVGVFLHVNRAEGQSRETVESATMDYCVLLSKMDTPSEEIIRHLVSIDPEVLRIARRCHVRLREMMSIGVPLGKPLLEFYRRMQGQLGAPRQGSTVKRFGARTRPLRRRK